MQDILNLIQMIFDTIAKYLNLIFGREEKEEKEDGEASE